MRVPQNVVDIVERNGWDPAESRSLKRLRQFQQDLGQFLWEKVVIKKKKKDSDPRTWITLVLPRDRSFYSQSCSTDIIDRTRTISLEPHRDFQMHDVRKLRHTVCGIRHIVRAAKTALVLETELKRQPLVKRFVRTLCEVKPPRRQENGTAVGVQATKQGCGLRPRATLSPILRY